MSWLFEAGSRSIEFTDSMEGIGLVQFPEIGIDFVENMRPRPRQHGRAAGIEHVLGQVVSLVVEARPDSRTLDEVWREFAAVWRADEVLKQGGVYATLAADSGRRTYGRPRPMAPSMVHRLFGTIRADLTFESIDDLWYGPVEETVVRFSVPEPAGWTFPWTFPWTFDGGPASRNGMVTVRGDAATMPSFIVHGPVRNPRIRVAGVGVLEFDVTLEHDQSLAVSCRDGWVMRDGAPLPGALLPSGARLSDMGMAPGVYEVTLTGYDPTGTGYLTVQAEPAFTSF